MAANTKIEWTDHTFNPWIGCTKVSPGCDHCYAERREDLRLHRVHWGAGQPRSRTKTWGDPVRWNKQHEAFFAEHGRRQRVFCASLSDVFDNEVDPKWRRDLFTLIAETQHLDWLLLTKRIGNAGDMIVDAMLQQPGLAAPPGQPTAWPWPNVWLGATVVNQEEADRDIPKLLATPARVRFLSIEPMLGPIDLLKTGDTLCRCDGCLTMARENPGQPGLQRIDWVIAGGESGPKARPAHPDWFRSLRDQCAAAGVPFLFKQWGEWRPVSQMDNDFMDRLYKPNRVAKLHEDQGALNDSYGRRCLVPQAVIQADGSVVEALSPMAFREGLGSMLTFRAGKKAAGRLLEGVEHNQFPSTPTPQIA